MPNQPSREDLQEFLDASKKGPEAVAELLRQREKAHRERQSEIAKLPEWIEAPKPKAKWSVMNEDKASEK